MDAPPVQYVTTSDGVRIAYTVSGKGRPFVMVPSPPTDVSGFWTLRSHRFLYEELSARYRLILIDHRGFGRSQRDMPHYGVNEYVEDLEAVVDKLQLASFVLYGGFAITGHTVVTFAARHPERVEALILWGCTISSPLSLAVQHEQTARQSVVMFGLARAPMLSPLEDSKDYLGVYVNAVNQNDLVKIIVDCKDSSIEGILPLVKAPTLEIFRQPTPDNQFERLIAGVEDGRLLYIDKPGGGLFSNDGTTPPAVLAIEEFLASVPPQTAQADQQAVVSAGLSQREIEVLRLLATGKSNAQIAGELVISQNTVIRHVSHIFAKIGAENRTEAASYAHRHNLT
jgi:pimeloyl-ACP methyl ester carboxylesterase